MPSYRRLGERVRTSCDEVMRHAQHVRLVPSGLDRLAAELRRTPAPAVPAVVTYNEDRALRSLASNAINFGSGYHDLIDKEPGMSGARTMNTRLLRHAEEVGALDPDRLAGMTPELCAHVFGQRLDGGPVEQLMEWFSGALVDLGSFIASSGGTAQLVLERCAHSAIALADHLSTMPFYRDEATYDDLTVSFYKRALITPADLHRQGLWEFRDIAELTAFADNLVPHVLRLDGAIEVDPVMVAAIESGQLLEPGGIAEVELRAAAVVAVEELVDLVDRPGFWAMHVDQWLWNRGGDARYKAVPRPRSRSVYY